MAWFSKVERLYWEQWCIQLHVVPPAPLKSKNFYDSSQSVETGGGTLSFIFLEFLSRFCLLECVQACCMIHGPPSLGFEWNHFHSLHCFLHFCFAPKLVNCFFVLPQTETMMDERQRRHATLEASLREVITQILLIVNEKKDHIPPVQQPDVAISFPFEISIPRYKMDCRNASLVAYHFNLSFSVPSPLTLMLPISVWSCDKCAFLPK